MKRSCLIILWAVIFGVLGPFDAQAQSSYPVRPITLIVPWPPGGSSDTLARLVANHLSKDVGQPVIVDHRPGAAGKIGTQAAAALPADGYTIVLANSNTHVTAIIGDKKLGYSPLGSFDPVSIGTTQ